MGLPPAARGRVAPPLLALFSGAGLLLLALAVQQVLQLRRPAADAAVPQAGAPPQTLPLTARLCFEPPAGEVCIAVEEPRTPQQYSWGMQLRPPLPRLRGMWFAYDPPAPAWFWMHRTLHPLDMIFVADGRVLRIDAERPPCPRLPCPSYGTSVPVEGVLEIAAGEAQALGLQPGLRVRVLPLSPAARSAPARD